MLLPDKHLELSESILGLSGFILKFINKPLLVDDIWFQYNKSLKIGEYPVYKTFDEIILALDFLFLIGVIKMDNGGRLTRV